MHKRSLGFHRIAVTIPWLWLRCVSRSSTPSPLSSSSFLRVLAVTASAAKPFFREVREQSREIPHAACVLSLFAARFSPARPCVSLALPSPPHYSSRGAPQSAVCVKPALCDRVATFPRDRPGVSSCPRGSTSTPLDLPSSLRRRPGKLRCRGVRRKASKLGRRRPDTTESAREGDQQQRGHGRPGMADHGKMWVCVCLSLSLCSLCPSPYDVRRTTERRPARARSNSHANAARSEWKSRALALDTPRDYSVSPLGNGRCRQRWLTLTVAWSATRLNRQ